MLGSLLFQLVPSYGDLLHNSQSQHITMLFGGPTYLHVICFYTTIMILPPLPTPEMVIPIVGIIETNNGRTCDVHRFGCGNALVLARPAHDCGLLLCLRKTSPAEIAAFFILHNSSDGCRVGFMPQE